MVFLESCAALKKNVVDLYTYGDIENQTIELLFFLRSELYKDMSSIKSFMQKRKIIKKVSCIHTHTKTYTFNNGLEKYIKKLSLS